MKFSFSFAREVGADYCFPGQALVFRSYEKALEFSKKHDNMEFYRSEAGFVFKAPQPPAGCQQGA